jgi:DNA-binding ferritin-like protein
MTIDIGLDANAREDIANALSRVLVSDQPTCDLLTQRTQTHEKTAWMRRSLLA